MKVMKLRIPPPLVAFTFALAMWVTSIAISGATLESELLMPLSLLILVAGLSVNILAVMTFRRGKTTINPLKPDTASQLMRTGIYRMSRNPMYLGMLLMLSAWALWLGNLFNLAALPLFVWYMTMFQIIPEELALAELFPEEFSTFKAQIRRWI
jgi:protein-S-isoprenylcysteine O-methyltransferase Ste14